ncbi:MAG: site-specific DNA-methyltransferase [Candidatus Zeuxoniibacter abyssi]|nr:MAG: site-specific DNA-methyltransferase [Candidatus Persebacteraceae bacterium AB1(2)]
MPREKTIDLRNEDCLSGLKKIQSNRARLIFADPPYNLSGKSHQSVRNGKLTVCDKGEWDFINDIDAFNLLWIEECARVLKDDGTLWISGTLHNHPSVGCALKKLGLWIINDLIWFKRNAPPLRVCNRLAPSVELIWIAAKNKKYTFNYDIAKEINGGKQMRNLWEIKAERHITKHPTEKPETLLDRIIRIGFNVGDVVMDPFMGSGTTGVVAQTLGRSFLGFEIDGNYFNMSVKRIQEATKNTHSKKPPIIKIKCQRGKQLGDSNNPAQ